jgi:LAS seventeen-binding protein 5
LLRCRRRVIHNVIEEELVADELRYQQLPRRKAVATQTKSKVIRETENPFEDEEDNNQASSSRAPAPVPYGQTADTVQSFSQTRSSGFFGSSKKKGKHEQRPKRFNLEAEQEKMMATIAEATIAATNLMNTLKSINREKERISENQTAVQRFDQCKLLRRKIVRYVC